MTFTEIVKQVPELGNLHTLATKVERTSEYCAVDTWCFQFKPLLVELVGWNCKQRNVSAEIRGRAAYELAYNTIYNALPPCGLDGKCAEQCGGFPG